MEHGASCLRPDSSFDTPKPTISCSNQKARMNIIIMHSQMSVGNSYSSSTNNDVNNPNNNDKATQQCSKFIVF